MSKTTFKHGTMAKVFHWSFVAVFAYAIFKQLNNLEELENTALLRFEVVFALGFLILLIVRFFYMRSVGHTAMPDSASKAEKMAAAAGHLALYGSVGLIAVSGLFIGLFFYLDMKDSIAMALSLGLHEVSVLASFLMVGLHIAASLYHRFKGDGIWSSMVPVFTEKTNKS